MYCVSINYKKAGVSLRRRFAFSPDTQAQILTQLSALGGFQGVLLCTCNRTELYFCADNTPCAEAAAIDTLARFADINTTVLAPRLMRFDGDSCVRHLFKVACGVDSMVVGEDEILGQTKQAYAAAAAIGTVGCELNMTFQAAIACAKKIKTETMLSKTSVSVATLAASEAARMGEGTRVLVIGASGKVGTAVLKNLLSYGKLTVCATAGRGQSASCTPGLRTADSRLTMIDYVHRYEYIDKADCVISATASPHYTVTAYELAQCVSTEKPRLFIDLAVPNDIDKAAADIPGVRLVNIDYFKTLAKRNNEEKAHCVTCAEAIIDEETDALKKDLLFHDFLPRMKEVKLYLERTPAEKVLYNLKSQLTAQQLEAVLRALG